MIILEQGVPSKRRRIMSLGFLSESHDFVTTHGSNSVIDETTERGNSLERQRIHELDSDPISEPELQLPLSSVSHSEDIGPYTGDVDDRSTTEASSMNNVSHAPTVAKSILQMDNINVPVVSFSGNYIPQADATAM
uniref:Uncharacterized protein n=1 Tax=Tanacetum cinerariifolium TaxID=118510 RepID=A0A6L2MX49_TANCI|nr:hypothetical protein [Tanacetum cinerariifolium]